MAESKSKDMFDLLRTLYPNDRNYNIYLDHLEYLSIQLGSEVITLKEYLKGYTLATRALWTKYKMIRVIKKAHRLDKENVASLEVIEFRRRLQDMD